MRSERTIIHQLKNGHILHQYGIDTSLMQVVQQLAGVVKFIVIEDGVDRHIDLDSKGTGIVAELSYVVNTVACSRTCTEAGGSDINGVGTMVDGRDATRKVLGRSQQFK